MEKIWIQCNSGHCLTDPESLSDTHSLTAESKNQLSAHLSWKKKKSAVFHMLITCN